MEDKVVFITGAASGIGAACSIQYARLGARLFLTDITSMETTKRQCETAGTKPENMCVVQADLTKEEDIIRIVETARQTFDRVDILLNVAGHAFGGGYEAPLPNLDYIYKILFRSIFSLCQKLTPLIIKHKGSILNISSVNSKVPNISLMQYSIMKSAIDHFTRCLALELGSKGVRVNTINPGVIETPMHWPSAGYKCREDYKREECDQYFEGIAKLNALPYNGQPEEIAACAVFLASDNGRFITGHNLFVDGGLILRTGKTGH